MRFPLVSAESVFMKIKFTVIRDIFNPKIFARIESTACVCSENDIIKKFLCGRPIRTAQSINRTRKRFTTSPAATPPGKILRDRWRANTPRSRRRFRAQNIKLTGKTFTDYLLYSFVAYAYTRFHFPFQYSQNTFRVPPITRVG